MNAGPIYIAPIVQIYYRVIRGGNRFEAAFSNLCRVGQKNCTRLSLQ